MKVVTIGGGGGHAQILKSLKTIPGVEITAICPSTDSGGSTGQLSQDYQTPGYLGDLTKCMAALCSDRTLSKALMHRFEGGCLNGHSVKNVLFLGLEKAGGLQQALESMYRLCGIQPHRVMPVSAHQTKLCAKLKFGQSLEGETQIDLMARNPLWHPDIHSITDVYLSPQVRGAVDAFSAIYEADWCVICPGDLYSSILPVLLPTGIRESFLKSGAKVVMVLNIMTKRGETDNYGAMDFVHQVEKRIGRPCDVILANSSDISKDLEFRYAMELKVQLTPETADKRVRLAPLAMVTEEGFVYHNPVAVAGELAAIMSGVLKEA